MAQPEDAEAERQKALQQRMRALQAEQQKRMAIKKYLTVGAYERLMNVRVANFELYSQLVNMLLATVQNQGISGQINEEQLKQILGRLTYKKESTIEFKHK